MKLERWATLCTLQTLPVLQLLKQIGSTRFLLNRSPVAESLFSAVDSSLALHAHGVPRRSQRARLQLRPTTER